MPAAQPMNGSSWRSAFHTVQEGVNAAAPDGEVWVAGGSYSQPVVMAQSVRLYGAFG
jgi:hypothetical protein